VDLATAAPSVLAGLRGRRAAMIFQNPRASLNPIRMVGLQLADVVRRHEGLGCRAARTKAEDLLRAVGIPDPVRRARAYPFQLSGGMCQRVVIAIAVAARPALLIADEPTTGLDVTTQATVMDLLGTLAAETGMATLLITHDLALAAERAQRIAVMHAGHIVETAPTRQLVDRPAHPHTRGLVAALPRLDGQRPATARPIGEPRSPIDPDPNACRYHGRCPLGHDRCGTEMPVLRHVAPGWDVACHLAEAM